MLKESRFTQIVHQPVYNAIFLLSSVVFSNVHIVFSVDFRVFLGILQVSCMFVSAATCFFLFNTVLSLYLNKIWTSHMKRLYLS